MVIAWTPDPKGITADSSGAIAHIAAFSYLSAALFRAHFHEAGEIGTRVLAVALWMFAFGVVIEVVQMLFVSGRSGELVDLAMDATGIAAGCAVYLGWPRSERRLSRSDGVKQGIDNSANAGTLGEPMVKARLGRKLSETNRN